MNTNRWEEANLRLRRNLRRREKRISYFNIAKHKLILDYGCGDGLDLEVFRKLGYGRIAGLDNSESYISRIADQYRTYLADACNTGLPTNSFDVIFINGVLHHINVYDALKEVKRILKIGGELCIQEPGNSIARYVLDLLTYVVPFGYLKRRRIAAIEERETYKRWLELEPSFLKILRSYGFEVVFYKRLLITVMVKCISR
jgi:ubiquinone/menaquinone biosynthesis C-methylase UbiE